MAFQLLSKVLPGTGRPPWGRLLPGQPYFRNHLIFQATNTQTKRAPFCCERLQHPQAASKEPTPPDTQKAL